MNFNNCSANYGGGIAIAAEYSDHRYTPNETIVFDACSWTNNTALYSPAVDITPFFKRFLEKSGFLPIPVFSKAEVSHNVIGHSKYKLKINNSHINSVCFQLPSSLFYFLKRLIAFTNNRFSALHLTSASVVFESHTMSTFHQNMGGNGAAIAMYDFSTIVINDDTSFEFTQNHAAEYGGGIYYETTDQHDFLSDTSCFIQVGHNTTNISK